MKQSGGLFLAAGWTAATPLFSPQAKMKPSPFRRAISLWNHGLNGSIGIFL
jgi:hypothetical protein